MSARAWQSAFALALIAATWLLLMPQPAAEEADVLPHADKLGHLLLFALLALLARPAFPARPAWHVVAALVGYGLLTELAQAVIPTRSASLLDLLADAVGAAAAFALREGKPLSEPAASRGP